MEKKTKLTYQAAKKELTGALKRLGNRHSLAKVFVDFMEITALAISNHVDKSQYAPREARYMDIIRRYTQEEAKLFAGAVDIMTAGLMAAACTGFLSDMLGELYMELGMNDTYKAQLFTPIGIAEMMGMLAQANDPRECGRQETLYDCAAGSGVLILGYANALIRQQVNYATSMLVEAVDIDPVCVHMCYIQLSMYGIPARVLHGNSLTMETFSTWFTPMYILQGHSPAY